MAVTNKTLLEIAQQTQDATTGLTEVLLVDAAGTNKAAVSSGGAVSVAGAVTIAALALAQESTTSGQTGPLVQGAVTSAAPTYTTAKTDPLSLTTSGALRVDIGATSANATAIKVDNSAVTQPTKETVSTTGTITSVASSASTGTLLASNANRLGAMIFNDSTAVLYLKLGATASTSSYTVQIASNGYWELPGGHTYTGVIDGIWASANGNARVTELT